MNTTVALPNGLSLFHVEVHARKGVGAEHVCVAAGDKRHAVIMAMGRVRSRHALPLSVQLYGHVV